MAAEHILPKRIRFTFYPFYATPSIELKTKRTISYNSLHKQGIAPWALLRLVRDKSSLEKFQAVHMKPISENQFIKESKPKFEDLGQLLTILLSSGKWMSKDCDSQHATGFFQSLLIHPDLRQVCVV